MRKPFVTQPANCVTTASTRAYLFICSSELRIVWTRVRQPFRAYGPACSNATKQSCPDRFGAGALSFDAFLYVFKLLVDSVRYTKYPLLVTGKTVIGRREPA